MLADALDPQGPNQHPLDVCCICPKVLPRVAHPSPPKNRPSLKRWFWHLKGVAATCTRTQRLLLHVGACSGPRGTRLAPLAPALRPSHGACTCGAPLTPQKPAFA